jgi:nitric oxide reductase NorQ protein
MKPSTRQRFVALSFDFPAPEAETEILVGEAGVDAALAARLVQLAGALRALKDHDLEEAASTRLLVYAATLVRSGLSLREACHAALVEPLTDDAETLAALREVIDVTLG